MLKRLFLVALATLNIATMTACGQVGNVPGAPVVQEREAAPTARIFAAGQTRKLGFDVDRYRNVQAPSANPITLPPVQGIMPAKVDLRNLCSSIPDQYDLMSCTAFAVGNGMREFLQAKRNEKRVSLSPMFLYYETRRLRERTDQDSGATITDTMKALAGAGIATETLWPYDTLVYDKKPTDQAYRSAKTWRTAGAVQLAGLPDIKKALYKNQVVAFGMILYHTFQDVGADGMMPAHKPGDIFVGGHAVAAVGYDDKRQVLILRNSFGEAWGDHGYFYMPYSYITPENVMDIWTIK